MSQTIWTGQTGCLLPLLIIFNLFFGKAMFNSTYLWLGVEAALVLVFIIKIHIFMQRVLQQIGPGARGSTSNSQNHCPKGHGLASDSQSHRPKGPHSRVVDVEGKVVEERKK